MRVKHRIPDTKRGLKLFDGVKALLGFGNNLLPVSDAEITMETSVDLHSCGVGNVKEAARLIASALAVNTTTTTVLCVHAAGARCCQ